MVRRDIRKQPSVQASEDNRLGTRVESRGEQDLSGVAAEERQRW